MARRPAPFLQRREREAEARRRPAPAQPGWFQRARDWTAFIVSLTSLCTAVIALRNTLTGPRPVLGGLDGEAITILRSDQFVVGSSSIPAIALRDEAGLAAEFPLLLVQPALANRAPPPNGIGVRGMEGDLTILRQGRTLFRASHVWYRTTASSAAPDADTGRDRLVFESAAQTGPFDLPGGTTWSREVLLVPRDTWAAASWPALADRVAAECGAPTSCVGEFTLRVRLDNGVSLTEQCGFAVDEHVRAHLAGRARRYFTTPQCRPLGPR